MTVKNVVKKLIATIENSRYEEKQLLKFIKDFASVNSEILDVACGYGRNMMPILNQGYKIEGIDINKHIVEENKKRGLTCYNLEEFEKLNKKYDILIFSHIIEHFQPNELKGFLEHYFAYLKDGGYIIIATPLLTDFFYWDFDHIKPYHPVGINMVFGNDKAQVQYYSKYQLELKDLWFRKSAYRICNKKGVYIKTELSKLYLLFNLISMLFFRISKGFFGQTSGWMGIYKVKNK